MTGIRLRVQQFLFTTLKITKNQKHQFKQQKRAKNLYSQKSIKKEKIHQKKKFTPPKSAQQGHMIYLSLFLFGVLFNRVRRVYLRFIVALSSHTMSYCFG